MNANPTIKDTICDYIKQYQAQAGYPPTLAEIARAVGKGRSTVHYHVEAMACHLPNLHRRHRPQVVDTGRIERLGHSPRAIRVL